MRSMASSKSRGGSWKSEGSWPRFNGRDGTRKTRLFLGRSRQHDTLVDLDRGFGGKRFRDVKKTICFGIFTSDLDDPICLGGTATYDAIFEKNICHGVSGNPAQKKIVMLRGHLDHYLHRQRLLRKGAKDKTTEPWRFVGK